MGFTMIDLTEIGAFTSDLTPAGVRSGLYLPDIRAGFHIVLVTHSAARFAPGILPQHSGLQPVGGPNDPW